MTVAIAQFAVSALIIVLAGTFLSRFADEIADTTGLGRLLIGSILLAGATSLPELTVDISAVRGGLPDIALGDLLGSGLFNLLILALLDMSTHSKGRMLSRQAAGHALSGGVSAAVTAIVTMCLLTLPLSAAGEFGGISYGLWFVVAGYVLGIRLIYYDQREAAARCSAGPVSAVRMQPGSCRRPAAGFAVTACVIVVTGPFVSQAAGQIADASGLGKTFVGTTLVACSTSLPELVTTFAALRMGAHDLAIGNIFGSNAFNMALLPVLDLVQPGPLLAIVGSGHAITGMAGILATLVVLLGQLYQVESRRRFIEPDACLVMAVIFGSLLMIFQLGS